MKDTCEVQRAVRLVEVATGINSDHKSLERDLYAIYKGKPTHTHNHTLGTLLSKVLKEERVNVSQHAFMRAVRKCPCNINP